MAMKTGVSDLHYAILTADTTSAVTYSAPVAISGLAEVTNKVASDSSTFYADNGPAETSTTMGEVTLEITVTDVPIELAAALLGSTVTAGVMTCKAGDTAPYVAVGFVGLKSNGKKRYVWLLKGQFQIPDDDYKSKGDKVEFQSVKLAGKFVCREKDSAWKTVADEDSEGYVATTGTNWFTAATINNPAV